MDIEQQMRAKLQQAFDPVHLDLINESHQHNVPKGSESHFKVVIVSTHFQGGSRIQKHKKVYQVLNDELQGMIKALSVSAFDPDEWQLQQGQVPDSPPCLGGGRD